VITSVAVWRSMSPRQVLAFGKCIRSVWTILFVMVSCRDHRDWHSSLSIPITPRTTTPRQRLIVLMDAELETVLNGLYSVLVARLMVVGSVEVMSLE
jgi:hypothetical protein